MSSSAPGGIIRQAASLLQQRQWQAAEQLLAGPASEPQPEAELLRLLGIARHQQGRHAEALACFERALAEQPDNALLHLNLGSTHRSLDNLQQAESAFRQAIKLNARLPAAWFNLGRLQLSLAEPESAADSFRRTLTLKPNHWQAAMCLGHALKATGDLTGSAAAYRKGLQHNPASGDLWWSLANIKTAALHDHEIQRMREQLAKSGSANQAVGMHFALGMALEAREQYDQAFEHFRQGNQLKRRTVEYDGEAKQQQGRRIIQAFNPELLARHRGAGSDSAAPIFIVSLPRSGSTLVEQILASHPQVNGASELPELGQLALQALGDGGGINWSPEKIHDLSGAQLTELGEQYIQATRRWQADHPRFTDKMPNNFPLAGLIALILPRARIINCRRHPIDTGLSCYRQLFARGHHWSYDLNDIAAHYRYYDAVSRHWTETLPGQFLDIHYEQLLEDQRGMTARILDFCGLDWHEDCMQFFKSKRVVRTASAGQVRQQLNTGAVNRWHHYRDFIRPLLDLDKQTSENIAIL